jgi:hypothetical protein
MQKETENFEKSHDSKKKKNFLSRELLGAKGENRFPDLNSLKKTADPELGKDSHGTKLTELIFGPVTM